MLNSYQELTVWKKSIELVTEIYSLTNLFPKAEIYGITSQMRRSAISIPSNIAEGYTRKHLQEYIQFIRIAFGSSAELETQLIISKKLGFAPLEKFEKSERLLIEVKKMLNKMVASLMAKL
ncbi:MAG: four helix bundle protein [Candidatus Liptonbacteria bacterium]|nr:four helix bundle protein [Candidatus Liptonbacteria bacterium]